jgi:hypothetical protein
MGLIPNPKEFQDEWFEVAHRVVRRIAQEPEILAMKEDYKAHKALTLEQRSQFISVANKVKGVVMHEIYGPEGSEDSAAFTKRWRTWYDTKGVVSADQGERRLTNEEHIVYSSTPDAEEFFLNLEKIDHEASSQ